MKNFYFSIIIPTLNEEKFVLNLFKDLEKQRFKSFEVLVVDGGSTDRTLTVIESYKKKFLVSIFTTNKKNVSFQRNFGAKKARGSFLVFLDADTRINSMFLERVYRFVNKNKALVVLPRIAPEKEKKEMKIIFDIVNWLIELSQLTERPFSSGGNMIVEKNFFHLIGGFDDKLFLAEDHEFIQRAKKWGVKAKISSSIKVKFNLRRMKKEGRLKFLYKSLVATFHVLIKGRIEKKIFDYPMGGDYFKNPSGKKRFPLKQISDYLKKMKLFLEFKL